MEKSIKQRYGREIVKAALRPLLHWRPLTRPEQGFSIVLGVPWDLRHLLSVNLQFVTRTDTRQLRQIYVVFDRCYRPQMDQLADRARESFPELPMTFLHYSPVSGRLVERVGSSNFFNSMNTVTALAQCQTQYAILHDFDLYPLVPHYFTAVYEAMQSRSLKFCGLQYTHFDGLTDDDGILGTWCLGIDVADLRDNYRPIHGFHKIVQIDARLISLDPYSDIQTRTPQRDLVRTVDVSSCCHVTNLCSTYMEFLRGRINQVAWRLHSLWYLENLANAHRALEPITEAMDNADSPQFSVDGKTADFSTTHVTCANVLDDDVLRMEQTLFGECRPEVRDYLTAFRRFLARFGTTFGEAGREAVERIELPAEVNVPA